MMEFNLYVEVKDLAEDDEGNKCPACIKICLAKNMTPDAHERLAEHFRNEGIENVMYELGLGKLINIDDCRIITEEEYEMEYGD